MLIISIYSSLRELVCLTTWYNTAIPEPCCKKQFKEPTKYRKERALL